MKVLSKERSIEPCAENGWFGYDIRLSMPIDSKLIESLGTLGCLRCILTLKRPFFIVHGDGFLLRGIMGDCLLRAGFAEKTAPQLESICAFIESVKT